MQLVIGREAKMHQILGGTNCISIEIIDEGEADTCSTLPEPEWNVFTKIL